MIVEFNSVSKAYGSKVFAIEKINLQISKGEFVFVTGRSGAGKSTLLKLIYRDIKPTDGVVSVGGIDVNTISDKKMAHLRRQMGFVFQDFKLLWDRSVTDNVVLPLVVWNKKIKENARSAERVMKDLDIWKYRELFPFQLSGGEQQKVAIARAMVGEPWILVADEPTGNLDPVSTDEVFNLFNFASQAGMTIIFATHNERLINMHKGRIIELDKGRIKK